jgi:hypothetical protein
MQMGLRGLEPTAAERAMLRTVFLGVGGNRAGAAARQAQGATDYQFGGSYIVFAMRNGQPTPVRVRTGLTDLDYSEVVSGLTEQDSVLVLPSASLVQSQQQFKERIGNITGGGLPGVRQGTTQASPSTGGGR